MAHSTPWMRRLNTGLLTHPSLRTALAPEAIEATCCSLGHTWRTSYWEPAITLLTFLLQVLSAEKTLRAAAALIAHGAASGQEQPPSADPRAYCRARQRWPFELLLSVLEQAAEQIRPLADAVGSWLGRRVWVVDGTTVSMPEVDE